VERSQHERLLLAITEAVAAKGYAGVTVTDVVERANVSRRTFYEHFQDKEQCFLAAYDTGSTELFKRVLEAQALHDTWPERARAAVRAYLRTFAEQPAYAKSTMVEVLGAGPTALARRRAMHRRYAQLLQNLHRQIRRERPDVAELPEPLFIATVSAVDGLVTEYIEQGRTAKLPELEDVIVYLELALLVSHEDAARAAKRDPRSDRSLPPRHDRRREGAGAAARVVG
jgi:AcrR family transcriptional regulator